MVERFPTVPAYKSALALLYAETGNEAPHASSSSACSVRSMVARDEKGARRFHDSVVTGNALLGVLAAGADETAQDCTDAGCCSSGEPTSPAMP
jgi:hypothetical protein